MPDNKLTPFPFHLRGVKTGNVLATFYKYVLADFHDVKKHRHVTVTGECLKCLNELSRRRTVERIQRDPRSGA